MKNVKLLLAGFILLITVVLLGVFSWLWISNSKNTNPLPILYENSMQGSADAALAAQADSILYLQAAASVQVPLDALIVRFESRYPHVQILARYVPAHSLLTLPDANVATDQASPFINATDMIIADDKLSESQLSTLQSTLNQTQNKSDQTQASLNTDRVKDKLQETIEKNSDTVSEVKDAATANPNEGRNLVSFNYAIKGGQYVDGLILTNNPIAIVFRNFLLSSTGQDILKQYDYQNIDGYKSSVDDLFNPTSDGKTTNEISSKITEALSNGK